MPTWSHVVTLDAADITDETLLSGFTIEEAERESALCDLQWRPPGGQRSDLILLPLRVDIDMGSGSEILFQGKIIRAEWEESTGLYQLRASNRLQEYFRDLGSEAAVEAALAPAGISASADFFGDAPDDLWEYAEQLLETAPYDCHLDRSGVLQLMPWEAGTVSHTLTDASIDGTRGPEWREADAESKTNRVILEVDIAFDRWKVREHTVTWSVLSEPQTSTFCDWVQGANGAYWPPVLLSEAQSTMLGGSWNIPAGLSAEQIPLETPDLCFIGMAPLGWQFERDSNPLTSASARGFRALQCAVHELYTITLNAAAAQTLYGDTVTTRRQVALSIDADGTWPPSVVDGDSLESPATDTVGDLYEDQIDDARRVALLDAAYAWGKTALLDGQRQDSRWLVTRMNPSIRLSQTVRANAYGFDVTEKVRRLRHTLVPLRTEVTLAVSRGGGTDDAYSAPGRPDSSDPVTYWEAINGQGSYPVPSLSHAVPTYVGSRTTSPDKATFAPDEEGFFTNAVAYPGFGGEPEKIYDRNFRVHWPSQEQEATGDMEFSVSASFEVATPSSY